MKTSFALFFLLFACGSPIKNTTQRPKQENPQKKTETFSQNKKTETSLMSIQECKEYFEHIFKLAWKQVPNSIDFTDEQKSELKKTLADELQPSCTEAKRQQFQKQYNCVLASISTDDIDNCMGFFNSTEEKSLGSRESQE